MSIIKKIINIKVLCHRTSDLMMAISDDLPGLIVPGRTEEELSERIPAAIEEIYQAQGYEVLNVEAVPEDNQIPSGFKVPAFIASASLSGLPNASAS